MFHEALQHGLLLNPGNIYDYIENHAIRISYAYADPEDMTKAIEILASIVEKYD